jgi:hypothetical protein
MLSTIITPRPRILIQKGGNDTIDPHEMNNLASLKDSPEYLESIEWDSTSV